MEMKLYKTILFFCLYIVIFSLGIAIFYYKNYSIDKDKIIIKVSNAISLNDTYEVSIDYKKDIKNTTCMINESDWMNIDNCVSDLKVGTHTLYIRNDYFDEKIEFNVESKILGNFSSPIDVLDTYYLALNGTKKLDFTFNYPEDFDKTINYIIENESIIKVENNTIYGLNVGTSKLTVVLSDGNRKVYNIEVTDIIQPFTLNNNKPYLPCKRYTNEEAILLDKILDSRVKEGGIGTRGGILAAARFLTLEFPYSIRYFNENGRLANNGIDGEGRYYHKGLYLSEEKYKTITKSTPTGPKMWGCEIYDSFISKMNMNGFTCSGFVTWAMLNGGFDIGDVGAGDTALTYELSDLGTHHEITEEYMQKGNYKVGDFIGRDGHAALIVGIDDTTIYTAESLPPKLENYIYGRYSKIILDSNVTYIIEMDGIYPNGDGYYTNMWY